MACENCSCNNTKPFTEEPAYATKNEIKELRNMIDALKLYVTDKEWWDIIENWQTNQNNLRAETAKNEHIRALKTLGFDVRLTPVDEGE